MSQSPLSELLADQQELDAGLGLAGDPRASFPWIAAAKTAAWGLLPRKRLGRTPSGSVVMALELGGSLRFMLWHAPNLNGEAAVIGRRNVVALSSGLAKGMFELSAAIWLSPMIRSDIGNPFRLSPTSRLRSGIPRGLEQAAVEVTPSVDVHGTDVPTASQIPRWLSDEAPALEWSGRARAFRRTLQAGLAFSWLHEAAHVQLGHLALAGSPQRLTETAASGLGGANGHQVPGEDLLRRAIEMEADRFAYDQVFRSVFSAEAPSEQAMATTLIGVLSAPTLIYAVSHLPGRPADEACHPPVWFRAFEALLALQRATSTSQRPRALRSAHAVLRELAGLHPMFGDWFGGLEAPQIEAAHQRLQSELLAELDRALPSPRERWTPIMDRPIGVDPVDLSV